MPSALCCCSHQLRRRRAAPNGRTACRRWHVAIARDEHGACCQRSADALPSPAGEDPLLTTTVCCQTARRDRARRARSVPYALANALPSCAGREPRRAVLLRAAAGDRDRARRARHVPSALCGRPPQPRWRRAAPSGCTVCRHSCVAIACDAIFPAPTRALPPTHPPTGESSDARVLSSASRRPSVRFVLPRAGPSPARAPTSHSVTVVRSCRSRPSASHPRAVGIPV